MKRNVKRNFVYFCLPLLLSTMAVKGRAEIDTHQENLPFKSVADSKEHESTELSGKQPISQINIEHLATQVTDDTDGELKAILFDHQSQETIGYLNWN
jgi:uncharacterized protein YcaQ